MFLPAALALLLISINVQNGHSSKAKVCRGTRNALSITGDAKNRLRKWRTRYTNCTIIEGNLEIVFPPKGGNQDFSFLSDIEEVTGYIVIFGSELNTIPLSNLKLIGGKELLISTDPTSNMGNHSLYILQNKVLKDLGLNSLLEITTGNVTIAENIGLCYQGRIRWEDIFHDPLSVFHHDGFAVNDSECSCHESCAVLDGEANCWGPEKHQCQTLTKSGCKNTCPGRCYGPNLESCCSDLCKAACTGDTASDCFRCRFLSDDGVCVKTCPQPFTDGVKNPSFKYEVDDLCLSECPEPWYVDGYECVKDCRNGHEPKDGICTPCTGSCPKVCFVPGDGFLSSQNVDDFRGCEVIEGNLAIHQTTFAKEFDYVPLTEKDLSAFENLTVIEGTLYVDASSEGFRDLSFLRNLKRIHGKEERNGLRGIIIFKTSLEFLGLSSLEKVFGSAIIHQNKNLCYMETLDLLSILKMSEKVKVENNRPIEDCVRENKVCHSECSGGCFGPLPSHCFRCKNLKMGDSCQACDQLCLSCHGPAPNECSVCKMFRLYENKEAFTCVTKCPPHLPVEISDSNGSFCGAAEEREEPETDRHPTNEENCAVVEQMPVYKDGASSESIVKVVAICIASFHFIRVAV